MPAVCIVGTDDPDGVEGSDGGATEGTTGEGSAEGDTEVRGEGGEEEEKRTALASCVCHLSWVPCAFRLQGA